MNSGRPQANCKCLPNSLICAGVNILCTVSNDSISGNFSLATPSQKVGQSCLSKSYVNV